MFFYLSSYISGPKVRLQDPHMFFFLLVGAPRRVYRAPTDYFLLVGAPRHVYRAPNYPSIDSFPQGDTPPPVHLLAASSYGLLQQMLFIQSTSLFRTCFSPDLSGVNNSCDIEACLVEDIQYSLKESFTLTHIHRFRFSWMVVGLESLHG